MFTFAIRRWPVAPLVSFSEWEYEFRFYNLFIVFTSLHHGGSGVSAPGFVYSRICSICFEQGYLDSKFCSFKSIRYHFPVDDNSIWMDHAHALRSSRTITISSCAYQRYRRSPRSRENLCRQISKTKVTPPYCEFRMN